MQTKPWLTAIHRKNHSVPFQILKENNYISKSDIILDYGCGHGADVKLLSEQEYNIYGYDKYIEPFNLTNYKSKTYDVITCIYVLNTIEDIKERILIIKDILKLLKINGKAFIAVRSSHELAKSKSKFTPYNDGILTSKNTFQKYFSKEDFCNFLLSNFADIRIEQLPINKNTLFFSIQKTF